MRDLLIKMLLNQVERYLTPEVIAAASQELVCWLKVQSAKTENEIDDHLVDIVAKALGVDAGLCPVPVPAPVVVP